MPLEDKKGREVIKSELDSEKERLTQTFVYVVDSELKDVLAQIKDLLEDIRESVSNLDS